MVLHKIDTWTMVTGLPDVRLTPYMGAVVLKEDLQRRAGVSPPPQVVAFASVELPPASTDSSSA
jgi:hypothetical protein